jgi:hypothetical protein
MYDLFTISAVGSRIAKKTAAIEINGASWRLPPPLIALYIDWSGITQKVSQMYKNGKNTGYALVTASNAFRIS